MTSSPVQRSLVVIEPMENRRFIETQKNNHAHDKSNDTEMKSLSGKIYHREWPVRRAGRKGRLNETLFTIKSCTGEHFGPDPEIPSN